MLGVNFNLHDLSAEALDTLRTAASSSNGVVNAFTQPAALETAGLPQGLQYFDYEPVGRDIVLDPTPLTNKLPRGKQRGGVAMYWREITDINVGKQLMGVAEGLRGAVIEMASRDRMCKFAGFGLENAATFESMYAAQGVANPKEMGRLQTLKAVRMGEERINLYGNGGSLGLALGVAPKPVGVAADPAAGETSTMTGRTIVCIVVALTGEGHEIATMTSGVSGSVVRTNAGGTTTTFGGGSSNKSAASDAVVVGAGKKVTWSCADVRGALGYAWYTGVDAASARLAKITTINQFVQLADEAVDTQLASAITADNSINAYEYNGVCTVVQDSNSGAYYKTLDGAGFTADSTGNISEFVEAFLYFYENLYISPTEIVVSPLEAYEITKILLNGDMKDVYSAMITRNSNVVGGFYVSAILNPFTGGTVPITVHPFLPAGNVLLMTWSIPYPVEGLGKIWEIIPRQGYYVIEWPLTQRKHEVGVYADQGLKCEFPIAQGIIKNVKSVSLRKHNSN